MIPWQCRGCGLMHSLMLAPTITTAEMFPVNQLRIQQSMLLQAMASSLAAHTMIDFASTLGQYSHLQ